MKFETLTENNLLIVINWPCFFDFYKLTLPQCFETADLWGKGRFNN